MNSKKYLTLLALIAVHALLSRLTNDLTLRLKEPDENT